MNATGVFADAVRRLDEPDAPPMLSPSQGAHLVLDRSFLPGETAIMIPKTDDGRVLFAIPWNGRVLVGTTDTSVATTAARAPAARGGDRLPARPRRPVPGEGPDAIRHQEHLRRPASPDPPRRARGRLDREASRESTPSSSRDSGLVTITGGKWTTYRRMGRDAVDHAARVGGFRPVRSATDSLKLHGWQRGEHGRIPHLDVYGSDLDRPDSVDRRASPDWSRPLHPALPYLAAEVIWAVRHEAARTVEDVLARRTRALFLDARASIEAAPGSRSSWPGELGRDQSWQAEQVRADSRRSWREGIP